MLATWVADFELRLTTLRSGLGWGLDCSSLLTLSSPMPLPLLVPRLRRFGRSLFILGGFRAYLVSLWCGFGGTAFLLESNRPLFRKVAKSFDDLVGCDSKEKANSEGVVK